MTGRIGYVGVGATSGLGFCSTFCPNRSYRDEFDFTAIRGAVYGQGAAAAASRAPRSAPFASLASTQSEYAAQLDPICQSYEGPFLTLAGTYGAEEKRALRQHKVQRRERRVLVAISRFLGGAGELLGQMTTQMAAVPPPAGAEITIATWLENRRRLARLLDDAALAAKRGKLVRLVSRLGDMGELAESVDRPVAAFGFQHC